MSHHGAGERLSLFESPIVSDRQHQAVRHAAAHAPQPQEKGVGEPDTAVLTNSDGSLHAHPLFHRHTEATNAELFYDLFFVANLTVFTQVHEVNDHRTLSSYIGFFAILWFTWYQVGLYDVRFSMDSAFERLAKACQFGVMIGFAITGPKFSVGSVDLASEDEEGGMSAVNTFRALSLILMCSRLVLFCQYLQSLWFVRKYRQTRTPISIIAATYFVAAMIYLGLFFTFHSERKAMDHTYIVWYVVAFCETAVATTVSSIWRVISFKGTHLVERMSLLTLIILGEGVMVLAEKCQALVESAYFGFSPSTIANIACAILIIYFLYQLYFDWVQEEHFGTIREQIWAFLHFPLHLALVLALEGAAQCIAWRAAWEKVDGLVNELDRFNFSDADSVVYSDWYNRSQASWDSLATTVNDTALNILSKAIEQSKEFSRTTDLLDDYNIVVEGSELITKGNESEDATVLAINVIQWTYETCWEAVMELGGFSPAADDSNTTDSVNATAFFNSDATFNSSSDALNKTYDVFTLTYVYFFVSMGLVVLVCTLLAWLSRKEAQPVHKVRMAFSGLVGLALCLLAIIAIEADSDTSDAFVNFAYGTMLLPVVTIALALVVVLNGVRLPGLHVPPTLSRIGHSSSGSQSTAEQEELMEGQT